MGNAVKKAKLDPILGEWVKNYKGDQFELGMFANNIHLENLVLNDDKINQAFKEAKVPMELKLGL